MTEKTDKGKRNFDDAESTATPDVNLYNGTPANDGSEDTPRPRKKKKIVINYIGNRSRRNVTFSKRRIGLMKKSYELALMTGVNVLLLITSTDSELIYTFATPKLQRFITEEEGKNLIRRCLQAND